jgi:hypothetical protein
MQGLQSGAAKQSCKAPPVFCTCSSACDTWRGPGRQKRIQELRDAASRPRFGSVETIRGSEWSEKVTNAGPDVWVVVHLYKEG